MTTEDLHAHGIYRHLLGKANNFHVSTISFKLKHLKHYNK